MHDDANRSTGTVQGVIHWLANNIRKSSCWARFRPCSRWMCADSMANCGWRQKKNENIFRHGLREFFAHQFSVTIFERLNRNLKTFATNFAKSVFSCIWLCVCVILTLIEIANINRHEWNSHFWSNNTKVYRCCLWFRRQIHYISTRIWNTFSKTNGFCYWLPSDTWVIDRRHLVKKKLHSIKIKMLIQTSRTEFID